MESRRVPSSLRLSVPGMAMDDSPTWDLVEISLEVALRMLHSWIGHEVEVQVSNDDSEHLAAAFRARLLKGDDISADLVEKEEGWHEDDELLAFDLSDGGCFFIDTRSVDLCTVDPQGCLAIHSSGLILEVVSVEGGVYPGRPDS